MGGRAVVEELTGEEGVGHGGAVINAENDGEPQRVRAADEGLVQDAVLPDPFQLNLAG
jgi:hypothetical protein